MSLSFTRERRISVVTKGDRLKRVTVFLFGQTKTDIFKEIMS